MRISVSSSLGKARRKLRKYPKKIKFASKNAINDTLFDVKRVEDKATVKHLDRPTPFTQRLTRVAKANTSTLAGRVYIPSRKNEYMRVHITGGTELSKGTAKGVPLQANSRLNRFGNLTAGARPGRLLGNSKKYFSGKPKGHKQIAGVWERMGRGARQSIRLRNVYKPSLSYTKRFPFYQIAKKEARRTIKRNIDSRIRRELASVR